jgi:hypothetical protein
MIKVINFQYKIPTDALVINTTSRSMNWSRNLSPFFLGPVELYDGYISQNFENLWQFAKVYNQHLDENGNPTDQYFQWAQKGWNDKFAHRYPMGRGMKAEYSYWAGEKLSYVEARLKIYLPIYAKLVQKTSAFEKLKLIYESKDKNEILYLQDFDAHNLNKIDNYYDLWKNPDIKVGHAYVLAMLLENKY